MQHGYEYHKNRRDGKGEAAVDSATKLLLEH